MSDSIGPVLGQVPSGIFILTAQGPDGAETGMLASWVQQASFDPPAITVAVNQKRYLNDWLSAGSTAAVSVVGETQKGLLGQFGKGFDPGEPAFDGIKTARSPAGLPVLPDSLGWLEGTVESATSAGDHVIYILRLTAAGAGSRLGQERPWVHIRKNGLGY
jgi:flavin reductase (DIM6/NTAB) family NADH-FMN oxidoreductase RutF